MEKHESRAAVIFFSLLLAIPLFIAPDAAFARDPSLGFADGDAIIVGGEPGEDPHLRVTPIDPIVPIVESERLLVTGADGGAEVGVDGTLGARWRRGELGMRAVLAWRLMFRSWFWTLQR